MSWTRGYGWRPVYRKRAVAVILEEVAGYQSAAVTMDQRKQSQKTFKCFSFPDWDNGTTLPLAAHSLNRGSTQSLKLSQGESGVRITPSSPSILQLRPRDKIPRLSARLPEHSVLPALDFSGPLWCCSKPQAGIAASRHLASSSASLPLPLLLLLSKSLRLARGAAILNYRKGLWGALLLANLLCTRWRGGENARFCGDCSSSTPASWDTNYPESFLKRES